MSRLSELTKERLKQELLHILYEANLRPMSTKTLADELIRDDELILDLLTELRTQKVVSFVSVYTRKKYWTMTPEAYTEYKKLLK